MRVILATAMTAFFPFDRLRVTTEINQAQKANNETRRPSIPQLRHVYPERSTLMSDQRRNNSTERLLEPSDTPVSPGTIRAVVVVGLITLFIASFLYWQSWKERHNKPPCVTKVKQELSDVVTVQCKRVWGDRAAAVRGGGGRRNESRSKGGQKKQKNSEVPTTRGKTRIPLESPVSSSPRSTTPLTSTSSSVYHSQASSQMFLICETCTPTERGTRERLAVEPQPRSIHRMPSEQIISHI